MKRKVFITLITSIVVLTVLVILFIYFTIKNSKDCDQLVIDTYEFYSGIDIPKQANAQCYYDPNEQIRVGVYSIKNSNDFISSNELKKIDNQETKILWSIDLLLENNAAVPNSTTDLYRVIGKNKKNKWQCLVDKNTGKMWFEIKWK